MAYTVSIKGVNDRDLLMLIESVSNTVLLKNKSPVSLSRLEKRIEGDIPLILKVLRSSGFYGARITYEMNADQEPFKISFHGIRRAEMVCGAVTLVKV